MRSAQVVDVEALVGITTEPLQVATILEFVQDKAAGAAGAVVPFIGIVRNNSRGHDVRSLHYEAYEPMAIAEMEKIAAEVAVRWNAVCAIWHRIGTLEVGEASLVVAVAAAHRAEAFEAARFAVDTVKTTVPVWKKEIATDSSWWGDNEVGASWAAR